MCFRRLSRLERSRGWRAPSVATLSSVALGVVFLVGFMGSPSAASAQSDDMFSALEGRAIGPAGMSGRVSDVDVVLSDPNVIFVGSATGGVFRSRDGGLTWDPVFDDQDILGIGAVQVFQPDPQIVWVGTGEGNPRNSAGVGAGVFVSKDGGDSWTRVGLESSERIHRIVLHPTDPNVAWVAALGPAWSDGEERGVFKTTDGGESWERVLFTNQRSGAAELVMDPSNPQRLVAAMWEYRREPWFFESGGPGSGLFVSEDGGETWTRRTSADGLPEGPLGRMGLAFAPSEPGVLYALVEATRSELLKSTDHGRSFETVTDRQGIAPRPFYYADLRVDPTDANRLYSLHSQIQVSEDGGDSFETVVPSQIIHGDVHELWIDPANPERMIMGNDGGIAFTYNRGGTWRFVENLTLAQFYHISVDDAVPFNVYGGLQDNGSWYGPSTVWENRGIMNAHWRRVGGGDGFSVMPDFADPDYGYAMSQGGNLTRFDRLTGARRSIRPVDPSGTPLRFNWNAALAMDPIDSTTIYLGSQFVHRSSDHGQTWEIISPDLTTNDPAKQQQASSGGLSLDATGAENHTTIVSIAPSSLEPGTIWVGTDDGRIQLTRNSGESWSDVGAALPGAPAATWVAHVEASKHDPARAYAVLDDHRRGNWETFAFRTDDFGQSWIRLDGDAVDGFAHALEEDPVEPSLLYLGTEFGLFVSLDMGESWMRWRSGVPAVPIRDLVVHPRDLDLVLGTHGRGILIVDDVRPLQALARAGEPQTVVLFAPPPAVAAGTHEAIGYRSTGHSMQFGEMRPFGALLSFWNPGERAAYRIEIQDSSGEQVASLTGRAEPGLNRATWNLRMSLDGVPARPVAIPGEYGLQLTLGGETVEGTLEVQPDPRRSHDAQARAEKLAAVKTAGRRLAAVTEVRSRLRRTVRDLEQAQGRLPSDVPETVVSEVADLIDEARRFEQEVFTGPECQGICGGTVLQSVVALPVRVLSSSWEAPSDHERTLMEQGQRMAVEIVERGNTLMVERVGALAARLANAGYDELEPVDAVPIPE